MIALLPTANTTTIQAWRDAPDAFGFLIHPHTAGIRTAVKEGASWALENGRFTGTPTQDFLAQAHRYRPHLDTCLFAVAPDVPMNHTKTLKLWPPWLAQLTDLGYPVAFVAQNGATPANVPWSELNALFIGGDDHFKDKLAVPLIRAAQLKGKWVHIGRVNWRTRIHYALKLEVDSIDGTSFARQPDAHLARYQSWTQEIHLQRQLL